MIFQNPRISKSIFTKSFSRIISKLSYWLKITKSEIECEFRVYYSINSGGWVQIYSSASGAELDWTYFEFDLSSVVSPNDFVRFRLSQ